MISLNLNTFLFQCFFKHAKHQAAWKSRHIVASNKRTLSTGIEEISIPRRIPRSPTDILQALASTVKRDPTAAHYKFHDDPYLIPTSNHLKRTYALAQEAGRKAATWIKQEHPDLFNHRHAEPFIEAFAPLEKLTETTQVTEDLLKKYINMCQVSNSIFIYGRLEPKSISAQTKQSFLELISFYNEEDQLGEELIEERWFKAGVQGKDKIRKTWKNSGLAEKVFNNMDEKTPEAYCALICGMAKHWHSEGAWHYFNEMIEKGFVPNLDTYNSILRIAGVLKENGELQIKLIDEILERMILTGIKPDVCTLNAILESISRIPIYRVAREKALKVMADFKTINVNPSLGTYYLLLKIFCREKGPVNNILIDIVHRLEKEVPPPQDTLDASFFVEAMKVCNNHLVDVGLARRLQDILCIPQNQALIGDSFKESAYYRNFFLLVCKSETPDVLMETYRWLIPNIYMPEQTVIEEIIKSFIECSSVQYIPEIWNDVFVNGDLSERSFIIELLLKALASGTGSVSKNKPDNNEIDPVLATAKAIMAHVDASLKLAKEQERSNSLRWTGAMLGDLMEVYLQYNDISSANEVMIKINSLRNELSSFIPTATLNKFIDTCVAHQNAPLALMAVDFAVDMGYDGVSLMAQKIIEQLQLDDRQQQKLNSILSNASTSSTTQ